MSIRRIVLFLIALVVVAGGAFGAGWIQLHGWPGQAAAQTPSHAGTATPTAAQSATPRPRSTPTPSTDPTPTTTPAPTTPAPTSPAPTKPAPTKTAVAAPGPRLIGRGDSGADVRDLQARLKQIGWFNAHVTGYYGDVTAAAVEGFQDKRGIAVTGEVDRRTLDRLDAMTHQPTAAELTDAVPTGNTPGKADPRCLTGRVLCVDKTSRTLRWMIDGKTLRTFDIRYGRTGLETREGEFSVYLKDAEHMSKLYDVLMPYSLFFSGGEAIHYSADFAANGYGVGSHGCVNVRDRDGMAWLFGQVQVGDKVVVYRS